MSNSLNKISSLCLLLVVVTACNKQLNILPTTQEVDGNIIVDKNSAQSALNGVYYLFANSKYTNQVQTEQWFQINEAIPSLLSGMYSGLQYYASTSYTRHDVITPSSANVALLWSYGYAIVNAANGFLKNIEPVNNINATDKRRMIAEANFLRAYANAQLLFNFGQYKDENSANGIILRKDFLTNDNIAQPRSSVKDCYSFIIRDIDSAIAGLPSLNTTNCYANQWAAKLLKARIIMQRGSGNDYGQAINLCQDIITNSPFSLEDSTKDIFLTKGLTSKEVMLGIQPYTNQIVKFQYYYGAYQSIRASNFMDSVFQGDPRKSWITRTGTLASIGAGTFVSKFYPVTGTLSYKTTTAQPITEYNYVFRLTEAYLLEAEAITASEGDLTTAMALIKKVFIHAGYIDFTKIDAANTPQSLRNLIIVEEMKNLVGESGQDWLAVRRLPFATLQQFIPSITLSSQLILPIPTAEMTGNPFLAGQQNPGYGN